MSYGSPFERGYTRLYVGHLSPEVRLDDLEDCFGRYGRLVDVRMMGNFAFVEFDHPLDAEDAVRDMDGRNFLGDRLLVEPAKRPARERRLVPVQTQGSQRGRRGKYRLFVSNLPPGTSWQDVKDLGRQYGSVSFADIDPYRPDEGILEFNHSRDLQNALRIEGMELRGNVLRVDPENPTFTSRSYSRSPSPNFPPSRSPPLRRSRSPIPREDGYRSPIPREDGYRSPIPREDGYRSPIPREDGYRSPIPKEDGYPFPREPEYPRDVNLPPVRTPSPPGPGEHPPEEVEKEDQPLESVNDGPVPEESVEEPTT